MKLSTKNAAGLLGVVIALSMGVPTSARSAPADIVVTDQDNGKDITLHGSQRLIVRLTTPSGTPYSWSALLTPDSQLAFTKAPDPKKPAGKTGQAILMVGGPHDEVFAFRAAHFSESSSQWFTMILCRAKCDQQDPSNKVFNLGITTQKK
jgi:predicted secreted protein